MPVVLDPALRWCIVPSLLRAHHAGARGQYRCTPGRSENLDSFPNRFFVFFAPVLTFRCRLHCRNQSDRMSAYMNAIKNKQTTLMTERALTSLVGIEVVLWGSISATALFETSTCPGATHVDSTSLCKHLHPKHAMSQIQTSGKLTVRLLSICHPRVRLPGVDAQPSLYQKFSCSLLRNHI